MYLLPVQRGALQRVDIDMKIYQNILNIYIKNLSLQFNGVLYNECTWTSAHLTEHKPWCSTFVDETGEILLETTSVLFISDNCYFWDFITS